MAPSESDNDNLCFTPFDCTPSRIQWTSFKQELFASGGKANDYGDSLAHALCGTNTGGTLGIAHAGAKLPPPAY